MRACQRELRVVVVERCIPVAGRMTGLTGGRELRRLVIRFRCSVVICQVTAHTGRRQAVILSARVALVAACCDVRSGQRELGVVMVERCIPVTGRMTGLARGRELRRFVIRFTRAVVIRQVTAHAGRRQAVILSARVALIAARCDMCTRQRELRVVVVERRVPVARCMALQTGCGHLCCFVIRISRAVVI